MKFLHISDRNIKILPGSETLPTSQNNEVTTQEGVKTAPSSQTTQGGGVKMAHPFQATQGGFKMVTPVSKILSVTMRVGGFLISKYII